MFLIRLLSLQFYATVFDEINAIENFKAFCSLNGVKIYGLSI
ncbi:MAG: hypothetical protein ACTS73_07005 [Arsenophonus sp. NEOnobi-MAG3]